MPTLSERDIAERVLSLICEADRMRMPGHRHTAERCLEDQDELRSSLRRLYRDLTGRDAPRGARTGGDRPPSLRQAGGFVPAALLRDRARRAGA